MKKKLFLPSLFFLLVFGVVLYQINKPSKGIDKILEQARPADVYELHDLLKKNYPEEPYSKESNGVFAKRMKKLSLSFSKQHFYTEIRKGEPSHMLEITVVETESKLFGQVDHYYVSLYFDSGCKFLGYDKK